MSVPTAGMSGRVIHRSEDYSRERDKDRSGERTYGEMRPVNNKPKPDVNWHPIAKMMWNAAGTSGMADFYQDSDWAYLYSLLDDLTALKRGAAKYGKVSGQALATIYGAMTTLGFTEGDRRRMRIELSKPEPETEDVQVKAIDEYRKMLKVVK